MGSPDLLFNLRNLFYLGAYQAAINNSDVPGLEADAAAERDAIIFRFYIALGSYQLVVSEIDLSAVTSLQAVKLLALYLTGDRVLGTATREEIQCMNRNYTVFGFPHIKAHPWHKFTIILLLRHLVTVVTVGTANQFAFSFLTVSSPTPPEWMNECFFDSHENLNFFLGLEWNLYLLRASGILLLYLRCHEAHLCDPAGTEAVPPAAAPGLVCGVLQSFGLVVNESSAIQSLAMSCS